MCTTASVNGIEYDTVGTLADALGIPCSSVSDDPRENCLCNARMSELGFRKATDDEGFPFPEWIIESVVGTFDAGK